MKKLIITVAIAISAVALNAATLSWTALNIQDSPNKTAAVGWTYALFTSDITASDAAKDIAKASYTGYTVAGTATMPVKVSESGKGSYAVGETASYYMLIWDNADSTKACHYITSAVKSVTVAASGANISLAYGNMGGSTASARGAWDGATWQNVPEPTSAMLLLLGVAGLALKRKQK